MSQAKSRDWASFGSKGVALAVKDAMFFPEVFRRLRGRHVIYVQQGVIIDLDRL